MIIWLILKREISVVKNGSFLFTLLTLFTCITMISTIYLFIIPPSSEICLLRWIYPSISFTILISCMFVKIYRIYRIFNNNKIKIIILTNLSLFIIIFGCILITGLLLVLMFTLEKPIVKIVGKYKKQ
jgi:hypothetical protein